MHPTKHPLPEEQRQELVDMLNPLLAEAIKLSLHAKQAHWNVKGPSFSALHELFDSVTDHARAQSDEIAERITALGGTALGTVKAVNEADLPDYPDTIFAGREHAELMANHLGAFAGELRKGVDMADDWDDDPTEDLLIGILETVEKDLWFVEAHLQEEK